MSKPEFIRLNLADSTNAVLSAMTEAPHGTVVTAREQTAGRGQRGNSWEAEPGLNITMSMLLRPAGLSAAKQFYLSEAVALAVANALDLILGEYSIEIKWPNDIYVENRKLAGLLLEHSLTGSTIERTVAGIGLNVNQTVFRSDAPNPVSLAMLTGREFPIKAIEEAVCEAILTNVEDISMESHQQQLHNRYMQRLWHRIGWHPYHEPGGNTFQASIVDIAPSGHLTLQLRSGQMHTYAFKEVVQLL